MPAGVPHHQRWLHLSPFVAPLKEGEQCGLQFLPGLSEVILVPWRMLAVLPPLYDSCVFEFAEAVGEDVPRCPGVGGYPAEAMHTVGNFAYSEQRPPLA